MATEKTIILTNSICIADQETTKLVLKRPRAKHLKGINLAKLTIDDFMLLAGRLAGVSSAVIDELDIKDLNKVVTELANFLVDGA